MEVEMPKLKVGAHRPVEDDDALANEINERSAHKRTAVKRAVCNRIG
jgi:hypothetical protein